MPFVDVGTPVFPPSPTLAGRSWLVDLSLCDGTQIAMAVVPAFVLTTLFFFDHNVSSLLAQAPEFNLKKPPAYHYGKHAWQRDCVGAMLETRHCQPTTPSSDHCFHTPLPPASIATQLPTNVPPTTQPCCMVRLLGRRAADSGVWHAGHPFHQRIDPTGPTPRTRPRQDQARAGRDGVQEGGLRVGLRTAALGPLPSCKLTKCKSVSV